MHCIVFLKQTPDSETKVILDDSGQIDRSNFRYTMNPYDEHALEEALQIKEKHGGKVTVITLIEAPDNTDFLTQALAMGADHAITVCDPALQDLDQVTIAKIAAALLKTMDFDLILCGKEAIDDGFAIFPGALAAFLDIAQINVVINLDVAKENILATREIDGGTETISSPFPALITAQRGLNEVRYPPLSRIMRAKRIKIQHLTLDALNIPAEDLKTLVELKTIELLPPRKAGTKFQGEGEEIICQLAETIKKFL